MNINQFLPANIYWKKSVPIWPKAKCYQVTAEAYHIIKVPISLLENKLFYFVSDSKVELSQNQ